MSGNGEDDNEACKVGEEMLKIFVTPSASVNVALAQNGAKMLTPGMEANALNEDLQTFTLQKIGVQDGIVIELGHNFLLNRIKFLLKEEKDDRSYSYYLEVSMNGKSWTRICDYAMYFCRSWQFIAFPQIVMKYIKLVGTHNTVNNNFKVVTVQAYLAREEVELDRKWNLLGLMVPNVNVARVELGAKVIRGKGGNNMINGDLTRYPQKNSYTCQDRGQPIVLQLSQPFILDSMRLLLWDGVDGGDNRVYNYDINVSTNLVDWETIVHAENERSWQNIKFKPIPVVFIWITGIYNGRNELHLVHFECPLQTASPENVA